MRNTLLNILCATRVCCMDAWTTPIPETQFESVEMDMGSVYHFIFLRIQAEVVQSLCFSTMKPWLREMKDLALLQCVNLV